MSDTGRKPLSDKVSEAITPDSSKSTTQKAKEGVTDSSDKVFREAQPDDTKSATQTTSDKLGHPKDTHSGSSDGIVDSLKHAVGAGDKK